MDVHFELGIQRLLDLKRTNDEMMISVTYAENNGPCVEDYLELEAGGGGEDWLAGIKRETPYVLWGSSQRDFSKILGVHKIWWRLGSHGVWAEEQRLTS